MNPGTAIAARTAALGVAILAAGCGTQAAATHSTTRRAALAASARPARPAGSAPGGSPPGGTRHSPRSGSASPPAKPTGSGGGASAGTPVSATGALTWRSGTATRSGRYSAATRNESGVLVRGGSLTLDDAAISTRGDTSSQDDSSFFGLNAGVLAFESGHVTVRGGSITTSGTGANGLYAYGSGRAAMTGATIVASGDGGHGAMAAGGGTVAITDVIIRTSGQSGAAVATDRGGGTVTVDGGTLTTSGYRSPGIYSTGDITVTGAHVLATGAEAAVVEGSNSVTVVDSSLTGTLNRGVMLYNSMSGDAAAGTGSFTMTGGSLIARAGPAFFITNTTARIRLSDHARVSARSGVLVDASAVGTGSGNDHPATVSFAADDETLRGDLVADRTSALAVTLSGATTLTGVITHATLALDGSSVWTVSGDSSLTLVSGAAISGTRITNIVGDGHTVTYDAAADSALGGRTYTLTDGGRLSPA